MKLVGSQTRTPHPDSDWDVVVICPFPEDYLDNGHIALEWVNKNKNSLIQKAKEQFSIPKDGELEFFVHPVTNEGKRWFIAIHQDESPLDDSNPFPPACWNPEHEMEENERWVKTNFLW